MPRRSQRKKAISPETIVDSSSESDEFVAIASNDQYVTVNSLLCCHKNFLI